MQMTQPKKKAQSLKQTLLELPLPLLKTYCQQLPANQRTRVIRTLKQLVNTVSFPQKISILDSLVALGEGSYFEEILSHLQSEDLTDVMTVLRAIPNLSLPSDEVLNSANLTATRRILNQQHIYLSHPSVEIRRQSILNLGHLQATEYLPYLEALIPNKNQTLALAAKKALALLKH